MGSLSLMGSTLQTRGLTPFTQVTVRSGDTLTGIARRMNVSRQSIMDLNDGLDPSHLKIGQKIKIPSNSKRSIKTSKNQFSIVPSKQSLPSLPSSEISPRLVSINLLGVAPINSESDPSLTFSRRLVAKIKNVTLDTVDLLWPVETRSISSAWGPRIRSATVKLANGLKKRIRYQGSHQGIDLTAPTGTNVYAALDGTVERVGRDRKLGNYIVINHGNEFETIYGHHKRNLVQKGDEVVRGQKIAEVGRTGNATGPHLHFEFRAEGIPQNPLPYLNDEEEIPSELQVRNAEIGRSTKKSNF
jgi:murein DD-endopeptidase MepM/ murein hydrolase activator NlpD